MKFVFVFLTALILEVFLQSRWISAMKRWRVNLIQKAYGPQSHIETKSSTPSMGGVVFTTVALFSVILIGVFVSGGWNDLASFWFFPAGAAAIGFIDDWIKFRMKSSEGFPSLYKLGAQVLLAVPWCIWMALSKGGISLWPGMILPVWISVPLTSFLAIGMLNAVNVTDGLDGLAAGAGVISMAGALVWLPLADPFFYSGLAGISIYTGFLWHNAHPAKIFMGDVGSHFLAGLIISLAVCGDCLAAVIPLGFLFGIEILSVSAQLIAIYGFKKKIFLMSPIHHHFELLGWGETQIVTRFLVIHGVGLTVAASLLSGVFRD